MSNHYTGGSGLAVLLSVGLGAIFGAAQTGAASASPFSGPIDDFGANQETITGAGSSTLDASMVGGERDLQVGVSAGTIGAGASLGVLRVTGDGSANGTVSLTWDGNDGDATSLANSGLGGLDLNSGHDAFLLGLKSLSGTPTITITVFSGANSSSLALSGLTPSALPQLVRVPYTSFAGSADLADVGAIRMDITSLASSTTEIDFLTVGSATAAVFEALLTDVVLVDNDANGKASPGDTLKYVVTIKNNDSAARTAVEFNANTPANTAGPANITATPLARDEAPAGASTPGDAFHTPFNTTLTVNNGDADEDLLNNDFLGAPDAAITKFGGGTLGGTVDSNNAGATAASGGHSLTVNPDGSFSYTPAGGFTGLVTFQYRLGNASGGDTATVTLAVGVRPSATTDSYSVTGNTMIDTTLGGLSSLTANDAGDAVSISADTAASKGTVNRTGANFTYTPNAGATGADSFSYTLHNGFGDVTGTVSITIADEVWYIDASVVSSGDGRSTSPFKTLADFTAANTGASSAVPGDGDSILIRQGTYPNNAVSVGALILRPGQKIVGDGWSGTFNGAFGFALAEGSAKAAGVAIPTFTGADPIISNGASGGHGIALSSGNTIRGLAVGDTPNGFGYNGGAVGAFIIEDCSKTGTGGALQISVSGAAGAVSLPNFNVLESTSSTGANLALVAVTGTLSVSSGGSGLAGSAASAAAIQISGGSVSLTYPGNVTKNNSAALLAVASGHTGTLAFNAGTLSASSGTGLQFDNADGSYSFNATTILSGGDAGIDILNGSTGTFNFGAGTAITNPSGTAFNLNGSNANVTYSGSITDNTGFVIDIDNHDSGTVTFQTGTIASTAQGLRVQNSNGGTINFDSPVKTLNTGANKAVTLDTANSGGTVNFGTGGLDIDTTSAVGFSATGGGTVTVQGSGNRITSTTGTALSIANTTIGSSDVTFQSVSANGAVNGIVLNNTGSSGGLTVTGTDAVDAGVVPDAASGGTIQNTSGHAISLASTTDVTLGGMTIVNNLGSGISGSSINGFVLNGVTITGNGNDAATDESGINVTELTGTGSGGPHPTAIRNSTISNNNEFEVQITNTGGTLADFQLETNTIESDGLPINGNGSPLHGNLVNFLALGSANMTLNAVGGTFTGAAPNTATGIQADHSGSSGTVTANISGGTYSNNNVAVSVSASNGGGLTFNVSNNTATGNRGHALNLFVAASTTGGVNGTFAGNVVGTLGTTGSGSSLGYGIRVQNEGVSTISPVTVLINGNTVQEMSSFAGVNVNQGIAGQGSSKSTLVTITGNIIRQVNSRAIVVQQNNSTSPGFTCANISGNQFSNVAGQAGDGTEIRVRQLAGGTFNLTQTSAANLAAANGVTASDVAIGGTITFGQAACATP